MEQAGAYRLIRPALNACWTPTLPESEWKKADATFVRDSSGHGRWTPRATPLPAEWQLRWGGFLLHLKPTNFGHLGFFAEQYRNWDFFRKTIPQLGGEVKALNLFAYSGVGSLAMAEAGAQVCHLDASRGMIEWGQKNWELNPQLPGGVR